MPVDAAREILIGRPTAEVAAFLRDPDNLPRWLGDVDRVEWVTDPPARVGSQLDVIIVMLGKSIACPFEVTACAPDRLSMRTIRPFPMQTHYTWAPADGGCRVTVHNVGEPGRLGRAAAPLMAAAMRRALRKDLDRLQAVLGG